MADILNTANSASGAPSSAMSYGDFVDNWVHENHGGNGSGYAGHNDFERWFVNTFGYGKDYKEAYEAYLQNLNNQNEFKATQSAREWDKYLSDTQYQRMVADLKKAGLNPWLAVQSGISGSSVPQTAKASYENKYSKDSKSTAGRDIALLMASVARLIAAL